MIWGAQMKATSDTSSARNRKTKQGRMIFDTHPCFIYRNYFFAMKAQTDNYKHIYIPVIAETSQYAPF